MAEMNNSYTSWADQWDTKSDYPTQLNSYNGRDEQLVHNSSGGRTEKYKMKVGDGLEKTKTAAATGFRKVKIGTSTGLHWIKDKYQKTTNKN
ncbi:unnamed protein product [Rhodiola kirilowii]